MPKKGIRKSVDERFWSHVEKSSDPNGCWLWTGAATRYGYGAFWPAGRAVGKRVHAHRLAWELTNGRPIPSDLCACHTCDVRLCVRPSHIFIGTRADNLADMTRKGRRRSARGSRSGLAKLTEEQVVSIREEYAAGGLLQRDLAAKYGIHKNAMNALLLGVNWSHVGGPIVRRYKVRIDHVGSQRERYALRKAKG